tara:strand:- start:39 stop:872 length:834 start_codon:yes stop_codon:yes gene_type:complete
MTSKNLKVISWNINSIRIRLEQLQKIVEELDPDIICLQETKCENDKFPLGSVQDLGYKYVAYKGQPSYNGVAIISRIKFKEVIEKDFCDKNDCRYIGAEFKLNKKNEGVKLHNFYVPAGGDEADVNINPKFKHKIDFLDEMYHYLKEQISDNEQHIIVGDMNIAPHINDVWSHRQLINVVSHTDIERTKLLEVINKHHFCDVLRYFADEEEKVYSWWSYRNRDWKKSNRGRRLDHIWITENLVKYYKDHDIFQIARDFERPSDHVPISITLEFGDIH